MANPEGLAGQAEALWRSWEAHLAALAAGGTAATTAGVDAGAQLAQVLETLWVDQGEAAGAAADALWERVLGR